MGQPMEKRERRTKMKLVNTFHGTEYTTKKTADEIEAIKSRIYQGTASAADKAFARRVRMRLCGVSGCTCGGDLGERPLIREQQTRQPYAPEDEQTTDFAIRNAELEAEVERLTMALVADHRNIDWPHKRLVRMADMQVYIHKEKEHAWSFPVMLLSVPDAPLSGSRMEGAEPYTVIAAEHSNDEGTEWGWITLTPEEKELIGDKIRSEYPEEDSVGRWLWCSLYKAS